MKNLKRMIAMGAAIAMLCTASITAMAADGTATQTPVPANDGFVCQVTGGVCTLDHDHSTGARICCTLDHEHTADCVLPACCTLDHEHTADCVLPVCCTLDHEHTSNCVLPGSGAGCGAGRRAGLRDGSGMGHHGGRGRHCA